MTDGRFSGGSVGLVVGHIGPEAALGGEIAFIEDGDEIVIDLNINQINCTELLNITTRENRKIAWEEVVETNHGTHPSVGKVDTRLLNRMRCLAVSAKFGAGMHPDRQLWICDPREPLMTSFIPSNKYRPNAEKAFK